MKISGTYKLSLPPEQAYQRLQDPEVLARCMPGCESLDKIGEDEYQMKMKMALASVSGASDGKVRISDSKPPESFRLVVEGSGKLGFMKGDGLLKFSGVEGGTEVAYEGDVQVGGTIAAVGQRMIDGTAKLLIKRFFEQFSAG